MAGQKIRFFGSVWGVLYIFASCAQTLSIVDTVPVYIENASTGLSFLVAFLVAELPFVGSAAGIYGAYVNWDLPVAVGIALFIWPIVILFVYLLRYRSPSETIETEPAPRGQAGDQLERSGSSNVAAEGPSISPWMANVLKNQVRANDPEFGSQYQENETADREAIVVEAEVVSSDAVVSENLSTEPSPATQNEVDGNVESDVVADFTVVNDELSESVDPAESDIQSAIAEEGLSDVVDAQIVVDESLVDESDVGGEESADADPMDTEPISPDPIAYRPLEAEITEA